MPLRDSAAPSSLAAAGRVLVAAMGLAAGWGALEASFRFMTTFYPVLFHRPVSLPNLFVAGVLNYGVLGLLFGLVAAATRLGIGLVRPRRHLPTLPFLFAVLVAVLTLVLGGTELRRGFLQGMPRTHPVLLATLAGLLLLGAVLGWVVFRLLLRGAEGARAAGWSRPALRRRAGRAALAVPVVFVLIGCGMAALAELGMAERADVGLRFPEDPRTARPEELPNVVIISIETLRADHVNALGYERRVTTPNLDAFAERGALFTEFYSQAPWTLPSMASLFSSLYPGQHGVVLTGRNLAPEVPTLAEQLNRAGYLTASFYPNHNAGGPEYDFQQDYSRVPRLDPYYISPLVAKPFLIHGLQRDVVELSLRITFPTGAAWYLHGERMNRALFDWLDGVARKPFFLHVHYLDPHDPYFEHPRRVVQFDPRTGWNRERLVERYDGEIRYVDRVVGELLDQLEAGGHLRDAIVVITADHGEEFLDHGGWGHRHQIHTELLHVPTIIVAPGRTPAGVRIDAPATTVDLAPTVLDLAGLPIPESFQGRSLVPLLDGGEAGDGTRPILSQLTETLYEMDSLIVGDWKLIRSRGGRDETRLFDRSTDPHELRDLADERPEVVASLEAELESILETLRRRAFAAEEGELSEEEREQLKALGYMD